MSADANLPALFASGATTADIVDQISGDPISCDVQFHQYGAVSRFSGKVRTLRCFQDNALLKHILSTPGEGDVLVVDGGGSLHTALMGDVIAGLGVESGWAGVIIYGAVRDVAALSALPLGIKALGSNPRKSAKAAQGEQDVPVAFGTATFRAGDYVLSDEDGIVVLPA